MTSDLGEVVLEVSHGNVFVLVIMRLNTALEVMKMMVSASWPEAENVSPGAFTCLLHYEPDGCKS